jgi:hypothetical protein
MSGSGRELTVSDAGSWAAAALASLPTVSRSLSLSLLFAPFCATGRCCCCAVAVAADLERKATAL